MIAVTTVMEGEYGLEDSLVEEQTLDTYSYYLTSMSDAAPGTMGDALG